MPGMCQNWAANDLPFVDAAEISQWANTVQPVENVQNERHDEVTEVYCDGRWGGAPVSSVSVPKRNQNTIHIHD